MTTLAPPYTTARDESLTHQVVFTAIAGASYISCNCRSEKRNPKRRPAYALIAPCNDLKTARSLYNDPANHWKPFGEEDKAKW